MLLSESGTFYWVVYLTLVILGISLFIALIRLLRGPSLPDRVISLDLIAYITIGMIATYSIFSSKPALLDAATVLALVAFLGTTAFARYVQHAGTKSEEDVK